MTWRGGPLWMRVYRGEVSCGLRPLLKVAWYRSTGDVVAALPGHAWQVWPPAPVVIGGRKRIR